MTETVSNDTRKPEPAEPAAAESTVATHTYRWNEGREVTKVALARVHHGYGLLQHLRTIRVRQRGGPSTCQIDTDAQYWDLPGHARDALDDDAEVIQWH